MARKPVTQDSDMELKELLPKKYAKPMADMLNRFTESSLTPVSPGDVASPAAVAVAVAIVIVLWDRPLEEMILTADEKRALRYAAAQISANRRAVRRATGIELSRPHLKLMEALAM